MAGVRIRLEGGAALKEALQRASVRTTHLRPVFKQAGQVMRSSIDETFRKQGRPEPWADLAEATIYERLGGRKAYTKKGDRLRASAERRRKALTKLYRTGDLQGSVTYLATDTFLEMGSIKVYAAIHQYGGEAGRLSARVQIPARPYIVIQAKDEADIARLLDHYISEPLHVLG